MCNRGERGKLPRSWISLSVKSNASCGYLLLVSFFVRLHSDLNSRRERKELTPATPKFSIAGILCPGNQI